MLRILHITGSLTRGGTEAFIMNHMRYLDQQEYMCDFLILYKSCIDSYVNEIQDRGGHIYTLSTPPDIRNAFKTISRIREIMKEHGPYDAIHCHIDIENWYGLLAGLLERISIRISHSHSSPHNTHKKLLRKLYVCFAKCMVRICATDYLACSEQAGEYLYGRKRFTSKGRIINNGIDTTFLNCVNDDEIAELRSRYNIPLDALVIGNISRFDKNKNQEFIVRVFNHIVKERKAVLILGGVDGGELKSIKEQVKATGLDDFVRFIGMRNDIPAWMKIIDVFFFPSLSEGFGIVAVEAQVCGTPCIASNVLPVETDLGLIRYIDLQQSEEIWKKNILEIAELQCGATDIRNRLISRGLDITQTVEQIKTVYCRK